MTNKVRSHPLNIGTAAAMFVKMVSKCRKVAIFYCIKPPTRKSVKLAFLS